MPVPNRRVFGAVRRGIAFMFRPESPGGRVHPLARVTDSGPGATSIPDRAVEDDLHMPLVAQDGLEVGRPAGVAEPPGAAGELAGPRGCRRRDVPAVGVEPELVYVRAALAQMGTSLRGNVRRNTGVVRVPIVLRVSYPLIPPKRG